jgi:5-methyltetrahydropteroyltriglutamate--homocysteine methyltransferase
LAIPDDPGGRPRLAPRPIAFHDTQAVRTDIENLASAIGTSERRQVFISAASPGVISLFFRNDFYSSADAYLEAIAAAMRVEYEAIVAGGFDLQIDCPDLAMGRHIQYANLDLAQFRKRAMKHVEALNHALANVAPERVRLHVCWGNYEGPHHYDVPFADIVDIVFAARPASVSFEAANPRHAHEWALFETVKVPQGKVLMPGVIESKSNFIEHPELIANRISNYARLVGRENVIAGSDCGYGTWVGQAAVDPDVVWAKFAALTEGARIATRRFWN